MLMVLTFEMSGADSGFTSLPYEAIIIDLACCVMSFFVCITKLFYKKTMFMPSEGKTLYNNNIYVNIFNCINYWLYFSYHLAKTLPNNVHTVLLVVVDKTYCMYLLEGIYLHC